jgi:hypothetical protein
MKKLPKNCDLPPVVLGVFSLFLSSPAHAFIPSGAVVGGFLFLLFSFVFGLVSGAAVTFYKQAKLKYLLCFYYFFCTIFMLFSTFDLDTLIVVPVIITVAGLPFLLPAHYLSTYLCRKIIDITMNDPDFPSQPK